MKKFLEGFNPSSCSLRDMVSSGTAERIILLEEMRFEKLEELLSLCEKETTDTMKQSKNYKRLKKDIQMLTSLIHHEVSHLNLEKEVFTPGCLGDHFVLSPDV